MNSECFWNYKRYFCKVYFEVYWGAFIRFLAILQRTQCLAFDMRNIANHIQIHLPILAFLAKDFRTGFQDLSVLFKIWVIFRKQMIKNPTIQVNEG